MVHDIIFIFSYGLMLTDFLDKALPQDTGNSKDRGAFLTVLSIPDQSPIHFPIASENILCTFANKPHHSLFSFP